MGKDIIWEILRNRLLCNPAGKNYWIFDDFQSMPSFCISSKPLNYAIALNELGSNIVHKYVGQEPSGRKFNDLDLDYNSKCIQRRISKYSLRLVASVFLQ